MDDANQDDWLPEGWRVQVHVRKNGRKDKWYFPPSGGAKFFSKIEVTRYLKRIDSSNNGNNNSSAENKSSSSKSNTRSYNNDDLVDLNTDTVNNTKTSSKSDTTEGIKCRHAVSNTSSKSVGVMDASNSLDNTVNISSSNNVTVTPTSKNNSITGSKIVGVADTSNNLNAITPTSKNHNDIEESTQVANSLPNHEEKEENGSHRKSSKKVTFEKEKAEGLPPGWSKEVKLTKKGRKIRRDPYYTAPEGNYTFRSLRDALRYIQTGEPGKLAIRRKEARRDEDAEDDEAPASAKKQKLETDDAANGTGHSSKVPVMTPGSKVLPDMPAVKHDQSSKVSEVVVAPASEVLPDVQTMQDGETDPSLEVIEVTPEAEEHSTGKSKKKKKRVQLPLRSSKRLAHVEPPPAAAVKLSSETDATVSLDSATSVLDTQVPRKTVVKQSIVTTVKASEESSSRQPGPQPEMTHLYSTSEARKPAPKSNKSEQPVNSAMEESGSKNPAAGTHLDLPLGELWEDPCIAFAIKTLTGSLDEPNNNMPLAPNNTRLVDSDHAGNEKPKGSTALPQEKKNLAAAATTTPTPTPTTNQKLEPVSTPQHLGSPLNLSAEYTWADPCIEFAIKTLTGAIPLDSDLFKQDFHQPPAVPPPLPSTADLKNERHQSNSSGSPSTTKKRVTRSQRKAM